MDDKSVQSERIKILAEFLDTINIMFKIGKINSEQKINIKQIIISHPKIIFDKYYKDLANINDGNSRKSIDSTLTLQKLNFVQVDEGENLKNKIKCNVDSSSSSSEKSKRFFYKKNKSQSLKFKAKDSLFKKKRKNSANSMDDNSVQNERIKILAEILDTINIMFKKEKINSEQKINIKQIIISHPKIIFDKYYKDLANINDNNDKLKMIEKFLMEELKGL
jgi:hypothetical protein